MRQLPFTKLNIRRLCGCLSVVLCCLLTAGCGGNRIIDPPALDDAQAIAYAAAQAAALEMPRADGEPFLQAANITVVTAHAARGYLTAQCGALGDTRYKLLVEKEGTSYYYDLAESDVPLVFPFQMGDGDYTVALFEQVSGDKYAKLASGQLAVTLDDPFSPFLLPNEYVRFTQASEAVEIGLIMGYDAADDVAMADRLYRYIVAEVSYDNGKARRVEAGELVGYLPDPDDTLQAKTGICLDYAALFACMLRANGIPAKLVIGYAEPGHIYHAWNEMYLDGSGWVGVDIRADGSVWLLADTTFAVSESTDGVTYFPIHEY